MAGFNPAMEPGEPDGGRGHKQTREEQRSQTLSDTHPGPSDRPSRGRANSEIWSAGKRRSMKRTSKQVRDGGGAQMKTRYSYGGDEHIFVEIDEEMSLDAFFKSLFISNAVKDAKIKGV